MCLKNGGAGGGCAGLCVAQKSNTQKHTSPLLPSLHSSMLDAEFDAGTLTGAFALRLCRIFNHPSIISNGRS
jgi:hypothetical protein